MLEWIIYGALGGAVLNGSLMSKYIYSAYQSKKEKNRTFAEIEDTASVFNDSSDLLNQASVAPLDSLDLVTEKRDIDYVAACIVKTDVISSEYNKGKKYIYDVNFYNFGKNNITLALSSCYPYWMSKNDIVNDKEVIQSKFDKQILSLPKKHKDVASKDIEPTVVQIVLSPRNIQDILKGIHVTIFDLKDYSKVELKIHKTTA